ncbi:phage integrase N-terminal SAM-like domain-containing protein [Leisingera sp. M523]|nr:phage integrase N-terminal SAM-like domain-containing protein [Leisingera sp. M523]
MTQEKMSPLRARMIEDMRIRGMAETSQKAHIRALKDFTAFLGRSPNTATPDELRAYQLHMTDTEVTPSVYNARITALRVSGAFAAPPGRRSPPTLRHDL